MDNVVGLIDAAEGWSARTVQRRGRPLKVHLHNEDPVECGKPDASPRKMNGRAIERRNPLIFTTLAYEHGYGAYLPVVDDGIDLILCRESCAGDDLMKVQMKTRWSLNKKYEGRDIWIAFPFPPQPKLNEPEVWYLAPHDQLVEFARELDFGITYYVKNGQYSRATLGKALLSRMERFIFPKPFGATGREEQISN